MSNVPPPLLGFNNNVRHRGRIFHIQTEDSGVKNPRIVTHLFADGGRIIKTTRTDYAEHVAAADMALRVRGLMKEQHKAMFVMLRDGVFDRLLEEVLGPFEAPAPAHTKPPVSFAPESANASVAPSASVPAHSSGARVVELRPSAQAAAPSAGPPPPPDRSARRANPLAGVPRPKPRAVGSPSEPSGSPSESRLTRPSAKFAAVPSKSDQSIFGEGVVSEKSLDEVILSYLADDSDVPEE